MPDRPLGEIPPQAEHWGLDPAVTFLNHGSFGACPRQVLDVQRGWRDRMEAEPVRFLARELEDLLDWVRSELGSFVGAGPDDLALVPNATAGINTVLRSMRFERGDELLTTDHAYNATLNAMRYAAARDGARVVVARVPFPIASPDETCEAVVSAVTDRTRLAVVDHVTSPTALILPVERLVTALGERGVDVLVDGAHAAGMLTFRIDGIRAAYYAGTAHKWLCAPKGSAFLHVRRDRQARIKPLAISHGANDLRTDRSRFRLEFDWTGTVDPSPWLCIPAAIDGLAEIMPGGWPALRAVNHDMALAARDVLCGALGTAAPAPDAMLGAMASVPLPGGPWPRQQAASRKLGLETALRERGFEVPIVAWPSPWLLDSGDLPADTPIGLLVRVSAQVYNYASQYERLAAALGELTGAAAVRRTGDSTRPDGIPAI